MPLHRCASLAVFLTAVLLLAACAGPVKTRLPATDEVGWVEFITPSRTSPTFTIIAHQKSLGRVALNPRPGEANDDRALLGQLTEEADRPLLPTDFRQVTAPPVGCSAESILIATRSGHIVIVTPRSLTRDGQAIDTIARRWFLDGDGTLHPIINQ